MSSSNNGPARCRRLSEVDLYDVSLLLLARWSAAVPPGVPRGGLAPSRRELLLFELVDGPTQHFEPRSAVPEGVQGIVWFLPCSPRHRSRAVARARSLARGGGSCCTGVWPPRSRGCPALAQAPGYGPAGLDLATGNTRDRSSPGLRQLQPGLWFDLFLKDPGRRRLVPRGGGLQVLVSLDMVRQIQQHYVDLVDAVEAASLAAG